MAFTIALTSGLYAMTLIAKLPNGSVLRETHIPLMVTISSVKDGLFSATAGSGKYSHFFKSTPFKIASLVVSRSKCPDRTRANRPPAPKDRVLPISPVFHRRQRSCRQPRLKLACLKYITNQVRPNVVELFLFFHSIKHQPGRVSLTDLERAGYFTIAVRRNDKPPGVLYDALCKLVQQRLMIDDASGFIGFMG